MIGHSLAGGTFSFSRVSVLHRVCNQSVEVPVSWYNIDTLSCCRTEVMKQIYDRKQ